MRRRDLKVTFKKALGSKYLPSLFTVLFGLAALTSTSNRGSAFMLPLMPVMLILSGISIFSLFHRFRGTVFAVATAVSVFTFMPMLDMKSSWADIRTIRLPVIGESILTDGMGTFERYYLYYILAGRTSQKGDPAPAGERETWKKLFEKVDACLRKYPGKSLAFGFRHALVNPNNITLQLDFTGDAPRPTFAIDPAQIGDESEQAYEVYLKTNNVCLLLLSEGSKCDFPPPMDGAMLRRAALVTGFLTMATWPMIPDRTLQLMKKRGC